MSSLSIDKLQAIIEAALMVAGYPLNIGALQQLFKEEERPSASEIKNFLLSIKENHAKNSCLELQEVASGYRFQTKAEYNSWLAKLWEERPPRYSRAFLETLSIIAYKQPITRAEIEDIRGVSISSQIMKTLLEREWVTVLGHRDIPGRPALLGTTKTFLDHFNLTTLSELPTLAELTSFETQENRLQIELAMENSELGPEDSEQIPIEASVMLIDIQEEKSKDDNI